MSVDAAAEEQFGPYAVYERLGVGGMATVHRALEQMNGNVTHTARVLKLSRKGLQLKMKELGLRDLPLRVGAGANKDHETKD